MEPDFEEVKKPVKTNPIIAKFKNLSRRQRIALISFSVIFFILIVGSLSYFLIFNKKEASVKNDILSNIDLDKLPKIDPFKKYDVMFIKNGEIELKDVDGNESLVVTNTGGKVIDFIQSKDKNKIAFAVEGTNVFDTLKIDDSDNIEKGDPFDDIPEEIYELNLEDGKVTFLWKVEPFSVERYYTSQVPSYPIGTHPSYPIYVDETTDRVKFNWNLSLEINDKKTKLLSYDESGERILFSTENDQIFNTKTKTSTTFNINDDENNFCFVRYGKWVDNTIFTQDGCYEGGHGRLFIAEDGTNYKSITWHDSFQSYLGGESKSIIGITDKYVFVDEYNAENQTSPKTKIYNIITGELIREIEYPSDSFKHTYTGQIIPGEKENEFYIISNYSNSNTSQQRIYKYNIDLNTFEETYIETENNVFISMFNGEKLLKFLSTGDYGELRNYFVTDIDTNESIKFLEGEHFEIPVELR